MNRCLVFLLCLLLAGAAVALFEDSAGLLALVAGVGDPLGQHGPSAGAELADDDNPVYAAVE